METPRSITSSDVISFLAVVVLFQAAGGAVGWLTAPGGDPWYEGLDRAPVNPPDWVFGAAWSTLYLMIAAAFWALWRRDTGPRRSWMIALFLVHMALNLSWNVVFFLSHQLAAAVVIIIVLIATAIGIAVYLWSVRPWAAALFLPYIGWMCFALYLAGYIWLNN